MITRHQEEKEELIETSETLFNDINKMYCI